ncbi:MAG TPA: AI-2E family transporter [Mycobacteriales bacterium]|nr:AI-2E family transporter [Mycobacteriales bacterium]
MPGIRRGSIVRSTRRQPLPLPISVERTVGTGAPPAQAAVPHGLTVAAGVAWRTLLLAFTGVLLGLVLLRLRLVVIPFLLAVALAAILWRQTSQLARVMPRSLAALVVTLGSTSLLGSVIYLVVRAVQDQYDELVESTTAGIQEIQDLLAGVGIDPERLQELQTQAVEALRDNQDRITAGVLSGATVLAELVAGLLLTVVLLFFCLRDGRSMWEWAVRQVPRVGARVDLGGRAALGTLAGYLRGTAILGAFDAVFIGLALVLLGVPLAVPLAALVFLGGFIPLIGATLTGFVAILVAFVTGGPVTAGLVLLAVVVVQQVESQVVAPVVLGRTLELHPVAVTASLTAGAVLGGVLGAAASVPFVAACWAVVRALRTDAPDPKLIGAPVEIVAKEAAEDDLDADGTPTEGSPGSPVPAADAPPGREPGGDAPRHLP